MRDLVAAPLAIPASEVMVGRVPPALDRLVAMVEPPPIACWRYSRVASAAAGSGSPDPSSLKRCVARGGGLLSTRTVAFDHSRML